MLTGKKVSLRPLKLSDWEHSVKWRNNFSIKQQAMMHPFPITDDVEKGWYEEILLSKSDRTIYFTIVTRKDHPIGFVNLNKIDYQSYHCYIGLIIGDLGSQGRGLGEDCMELLMSYAFFTLNIRKLYVEVLASNIAAIKLYKKLGFTEEGRLKQHFYVEGRYIDMIIMSTFKNAEMQIRQ